MEANAETESSRIWSRAWKIEYGKDLIDYCGALSALTIPVYGYGDMKTKAPQEN